MNLFDFADKIEKRADKLAEQASLIKQAVARELVEALIYATPVDTSQAVSNWTANVGTPPNAFIEAHSPGFNGSTFTASARESISLAAAIILAGGPGKSLWLANNAPYIIDLNNGTSKQAPAMFVEQTIARVRGNIPNIAKQVFNGN